MLIAVAGAEDMGRLCHLLGPTLRARVRASVDEENDPAFESALSTRVPATVCFRVRTDVLLVVEALLRVRHARLQSAVMSAAKAIEKAHAATIELLAKDGSTRLLTGEQRRTLGEIATMLAAAHGELWMTGGSQERAGERLDQAFKASVALNRSADLPRPALDEMTTVQEDIAEAGRLLGIDLML